MLHQFSQQRQPRVIQLCCTSGHRQFSPEAIGTVPCLGEGQMTCSPQSAGKITGPEPPAQPLEQTSPGRVSQCWHALARALKENTQTLQCERKTTRLCDSGSQAVFRRCPSLCKATAALPAGDQPAAVCHADGRRDSPGSSAGSCLPAELHVPCVIPMESHCSSQPSSGSMGSQLRICLFTCLLKRK